MLTAPEEALEPRVLLMTITGLFRIRQIGVAFFVEQLQRVPRVEAGEMAYDEEWKVMALAKPSTAREGRTPYQEAVDFMQGANQQVLAIMAQERKTKQHAARYSSGKEHAQPR